MINYKLINEIILREFFFCVCYAKSYFQKNTDFKKQIILFLFYRPTGPIVFAVLPVDQKINSVSPNEKPFPTAPVVAFCRTKNTKDKVVRTNLHPPKIILVLVIQKTSFTEPLLNKMTVLITIEIARYIA